MARLRRDYAVAQATADAVQAARRRLVWVLVTLATLFLLAGLALYLVRHGMSAPNWQLFAGVPRGLHRPGHILALALHGDALAIIDLGALALVAAPVLQLALAVAVFMRRRDGLYAFFSLLVLAILLGGLSLGWWL